jgi:hypothetical protein
MTAARSLASRISALALLSLTLPAPVAAQEGAQDIYDTLFQAYFDGESMDTLPEYQARLLLVDHIAGILKEDPELKGWTDADTRDAITAFGTPARAPYKQRVADRLRAAIQPARAKAATELAADPAALATIKCVARRTSRAAAEWAACATKGGRPFTAAEQALGTEALETVNAVVSQPDLNSAVVGIICHTLGRFGDRVSSDGMTRKYTMTISLLSAEKPLACDRAKPRYAALVGHDSYMKIEPALLFESEKEGE